MATCARCHDHKFDPIPTADYYALAGIFYSSHIMPDVGPKTGGALMLRIPLLSATELAAREAGKGQLAELKTQLASLFEQDYRKQAQSLVGQTRVSDGGMGLPKMPTRPRPISRSTQFAASVSSTPRLLGAMDRLSRARRAENTLEVRGRRRGVAGLRTWMPDNAPSPVFQVNPTDTPARADPWTIPSHSAAVHPSPTGGLAGGLEKSDCRSEVRIRGRIVDGDPNGGGRCRLVGRPSAGSRPRQTRHRPLDNGRAPGFGGLADLQ